MRDVPLIPLEVFFGDAKVANVKVSPDGRFISFVAPLEGFKNIWVQDLKTGEKWPVTKEKGREVFWYQWAWNGEQILYFQDIDGDENFRIFAIDYRGESEPKLLTPEKDVQALPIRSHPDFPDEVLIHMNERDRSLMDIFRLNTRTGKLELVFENTVNAMSFVADEKLDLVAYTTPLEEGGFAVYAKRNGRFEHLFDVYQDDELATSLITARNGKLYMVSSVGRNTNALIELDLKSLQEKVLASDDEYDLHFDFLFHPKAKRPEAISIVRDKLEWIVLDPDLEDDFRRIGELESGSFKIVSLDGANKLWLIMFEGDRQSMHYYLYDRETKDAKLLFVARPELEKYPLAEMKPIKYTARDGLTIHGYLTLPVGVEPKNLPVVVLVHGGPWWRDVWGYDPIAQWLANRGYAVLQINFRGSTGYGKKFINAAMREWGGKMQDDITDGVKWLIEQGIADPKRIAIMGGSYGGYATLAGVAFTPELYRCGVDIVGPSNLITFIKSIPPYWKPYLNMIYRHIGHPEKDEEFLKSRSPLFSVDKIRVPLLIGQGKNDPRVKRTESLQIVEALKKRGIPVEYVEYPDEGHGLMKEENRLDFFRRADKFLAKHLGGRCE